MRQDSQSQLIALLETLYNSRNPTRRWLHCTRRDWLIAKIAECARERPGRALEIGFGAGVYLRALANYYNEVVGTDLNQSQLEHARARTADIANLHVLIDDITDSQLPVHSFDLVLCSEVLEHIRDTGRAIAGIRRVVAPSGLLVISTPQRHSVMELACKLAFMPGVINLVRRVYGEAVFETGHISLMTERQITRALESAGFHIRQRFKSGLYLPLVAEFAGVSGMRFERWLEERLRDSFLSWTLWTQYYVAQSGPSPL
ncbi:MAG: methyltransferase domain-containing protein [Deltaproteobacteria bacterium]|nr:methyltransferase domain-containing protein [Deltaproteobacteria bacterium]